MNASMKTRPALLAGAALLTLLGTGCATKKHVRQAVGPVETRVGSVERRTAEQAAALGDVENNVSRVDERAMEADRKAAAAGQAAQGAQMRADAAHGLAGEAQQMADQTRSRLTEVVGNLDNYQHVTTESIFFAVNKSKLTKDEMQKLDDAVAKLQGNNNYILEIQGYADKTGTAAKNLELSRKRADEVVRYVTLKHNVPLRRIHVLGLGADVPDADNSSREARKQNRRVDINVYARAIDGSGSGTTAATSSSFNNQGSVNQQQDRSRTSPTGSADATTGRVTPQSQQ
jgi:outer membrane protein OmpA-like peptidoglycan-associated protein